MTNVAVLGSTGFIGTRALDVIRKNSDRLHVTALTAHKNTELLLKQIEEFRPELVGVTDVEAGERIRPFIPSYCRLEVGKESAESVAAYPKNDIALVAIVGIASLPAVMAALEAGHDIAVASKEALVTGGSIVTALAKKKGKKILPVDSEHSAIYQCLASQGEAKDFSIYLTCSGGPFRTWNREEIAAATPAQALKHPTWSMGSKITIDSSTLMNKGLEIIEAGWLFGVDCDRITVVVHPESIIHSMVRLSDGAVLAQLGAADMRLPIQYALLYGERGIQSGEELDIFALKGLNFERPREDVFPCLNLARSAMKMGGLAPTALNAANEIAVEAYLNGKIGFYDISDTVEKMLSVNGISAPVTCIENVYAMDWYIRALSMEHISKIIRA